MILWSIQHELVYEKMRKTGVLRADRNFILEDGYGDSYLWMTEQMNKRIGEPPKGVVLPVWAWYQWEGKWKSWENIFDIRCSFDGEVHRSLNTQATMWEIKSEWVKRAEHFVSR